MIERHSKVFVPVFGKDADHIFIELKFKFPVEEKENVYVLTEQELQQIIVDAVFEHKNTTIDKFMEKLNK